ncbi:alpha/beta hydrolase [Mycolicibacterium hodleri]|uniref:Alpha/beta hydrolase n=1 Tax=Mycolicibacterium hodleri TaxID=49897 RepID=A0A502EFQ2_9MYCO|nr:alpha/beta hydrolase [Mycolicibacterium hodleri]TPG36553.1 alpha/beta hydrolase [Mycolicibacterium hodleri]
MPTRSGVSRHQLRIDVSDAVGLPEAIVAATVIVPADAVESQTLAVAFPGGGYSRGYWDIQWHGSYSQAEYHVSRGWVFAAIDHLGVGESSLPDPTLLSFEVMGRANAAASQHIVSALRSGELADSLGPTAVPFVIGIGQSMGGCVSIVAQALYRPFDALAVLGYSAAHTVLPSPSGGVHVSAVERGRTDMAGIVDEAGQIGSVDVFSWSFHFDDVDPAIRHKDLRGGFPFRTDSVPPWGSATIPPAAASMLAPGVVAKEAAALTVPVFIGVGERDVCPDAHTEPASYPGADHVTVCVVDRMAHMHNFASSRNVLWNRLHRWGESLR